MRTGWGRAGPMLPSAQGEGTGCAQSRPSPKDFSSGSEISPKCGWCSQVTHSEGAGPASLLSVSPSHAQAPVVFRYQKELQLLASTSLGPSGFLKTNLDQLNKENGSSASSIGLSPADPMSQTKFICLGGLRVSVPPPTPSPAPDPGRGRRMLFKKSPWPSTPCSSASIIQTKKAPLVSSGREEGKPEGHSQRSRLVEGAGVLGSRPGCTVSRPW